MVRSHFELNRSIARANRLAVDECVRFFGRDRDLQFSPFRFLSNSGRTEQDYCSQDSAKYFAFLISHKSASQYRQSHAQVHPNVSSTARPAILSIVTAPTASACPRYRPRPGVAGSSSWGSDSGAILRIFGISTFRGGSDDEPAYSIEKGPVKMEGALEASLPRLIRRRYLGPDPSLRLQGVNRR